MPSTNVHRFRRSLGMLACTVFLVACGGNGDDGTYGGVLAGAFEDHEAGLGLFLPSENFHNLCENPRDLGERGAFEDDRSGSAVDEKNFLRSYIYDTYLWYDEVEYPNPTDERYSVLEYFYAARTLQFTPSGKLKDQYSGALPTAEWLAYGNRGVISGYGFERTMATLNEEVVVLHAEPGSPADRNGLSRGARIVSIEGREGPVMTDLIRTSEADLNALYPSGIVSTQGLEFEVRDPGSAATRTLRMRPTEYTIDPVRYTRAIDTDTGPVGYLYFSNHNEPSEKQLIEAFRELAEADVTDLVLDLRYNSGGRGGIANEVASMIAGPSAASGKVFLRPRFNDKHPSINPITKRPIDPGYFVTAAIGYSAERGMPLPSLNLSRVFILTTIRTCSASEAIINGLRGINVEVILIGDTTCGKPYGFYGTDNCGTTYLAVQMQATNNNGFGDYADGFSPQNALGPKGVSTPGCTVADNPDHVLGDVDEGLLVAALRYRVDGSCPAPSRSAAHPAAVGDMPWNIGVMTMQ